MQIVRTETPTGGPNRTRREEIVPLNTGTREVEPELYVDASQSEGWPWDSDPSKNTWLIQLGAIRDFITPFEQLDSQAAAEQAGGSDEEGGVYTYPFSNLFLPVGEGPDDGDLNSSNWGRKWTAFANKYFGGANQPQRGGTVIMTAVQAGDEHFMGEFGPGGDNEKPRDERPVRARTLFSDGAITDEADFRAYLAQTTLDRQSGYGRHGEWDEVWAIAILGQPGDDAGKAAYDQYVRLGQDHPWIHAYYFEGVTNSAEIAEDMAVAVAPTQA